MKIKLYSWYDHFTLTQTPKCIEWTKASAPVVFYSDTYVQEEVAEKNACALLIEPRSIQPKIYEYMEQNYQKFKYVFTHDSILLEKLPNAKLILWGGVYEYNDIPKTKDISFVSSDKRMCDLHIKRLELAKQLENDIDCMGTYNHGRKVNTKEIYAPYRFSVVIENYIDDYWFSEKICNCFANKTVPIYYGARKIGDYFDLRGIITVDNIEQIPTVVRGLRPEFAYDLRIPFIDENYERVKKFTCFEDTFYEMHKDLLEELANDNK